MSKIRRLQRVVCVVACTVCFSVASFSANFIDANKLVSKFKDFYNTGNNNDIVPLFTDQEEVQENLQELFAVLDLAQEELGKLTIKSVVGSDEELDRIKEEYGSPLRLNFTTPSYADSNQLYIYKVKYKKTGIGFLELWLSDDEEELFVTSLSFLVPQEGNFEVITRIAEKLQQRLGESLDVTN